MPDYSIRADVLTVEIDDEIVVMDPTESAYFALNEPASDIWKLIADGRGRSVEALCRLLAETYRDVPAERMRQDVERLLERLSAAGLLPRVSAADTPPE